MMCCGVGAKILLVLGVMLDSVRFAPSIRIDQLRDNKAVVAYAVCLSDGERIASHRLDRAPDVDDLHTSLNQLIGLVRKVMRYSRQGRFVGLVDVHTLDRPAARCIGTAARGRVLGGLTSNRVVENKDSRCASAVSR